MIIKSRYLAVFVGVLLFSGVSLRAVDIDNRIELAARDSYVFKTYLKDDKISIKANDNIVTLTGTVQDDSHIALAEDTVTNLPGVKMVENRLSFSGARPAPNSDAWIATKVKAALLFHQNVSSERTEVNVKNGVVTLNGDADSKTQKELTADYARDVEGVREVNNNMNILSNPIGGSAMADNIDDASVTAQVKMALLARRSTSTIVTSVSTDHGLVTLKGNAKNEFEKGLVEKLAQDVKGVKKINNEMTVPY